MSKLLCLMMFPVYFNLGGAAREKFDADQILEDLYFFMTGELSVTRKWLTSEAELNCKRIGLIIISP
jgi:hypothetical protein